MSDKVEQRNRRVLEAAISLARERGFRKFSRHDVAARAGVAAGSVNNAYGTMDDLHDAVMREAVKLAQSGTLVGGRGTLEIVAAGLAARHPLACNAPQHLKDSALASLAA